MRGQFRILAITSALPYPPTWGTGMRNCQLLRQLASRHQVTLLSYARELRLEYLNELRRAGLTVHVVAAPLQTTSEKRRAQLVSLFRRGSYHYSWLASEPMRERAERLLAGTPFDVALVATSCMMWSLRDALPIPIVLDEHNLEYELLRRSLNVERSLSRRLYYFSEYVKSLREERRCWDRAAAIAVTSAREELIVRSARPAKPTAVVKNGVDLSYFQPDDGVTLDQDRIVFSGLMDYRPNVDAAAFFIRQILPRILRAKPNAVFTVVGADPPDEITRLAGTHVEITGRVPDVRPFVLRAGAVVVPMRIGSGTRLKVGEALAMGKAVVSTGLGCEGLPVQDGEHVLLAESPDHFAETVIRVLSDPNLRRGLGARGRDLARQQLSWNAPGTALENLIREAVLGARGGVQAPARVVAAGDEIVVG